MKSRTMLLFLALCAGIIITQTGCENQEPVEQTEFLLNTACVITVYDTKGKEAQAVIQAGFDCCRHYENLLSKTIEGSDIYRLNHAKGQPVAVSDPTLEVIKQGIRYGDLSEGMFDITIGAVSELWDFTNVNAPVPDEKKVRAAVKTVDYKQIKIQGNQVRLENPKAQVDLGGIAKGYIADRMTEVMERQGAKRAIINLGGNIVTIGEKEEGKPWNIGVERPYSDRTEILGSVEISDAAISTSGIYERFIKQNGRLYNHVLNPKTGYSIENSLDSVTILAEKGRSADCDALGTICLMLGEEKGGTLLEGMEGVQGVFVDQDENLKTINGMKIKETH